MVAVPLSVRSALGPIRKNGDGVQVSDTLIQLATRRAEAVLIRRFPPQPDVRRMQFDIEDRMKAYIGGEAVAAPAQNPNMLRFTMQSGRRSLFVADNSATLNMSFESLPQSGLAQPLQKAAAEMDKLDELFSGQATFFRAIALTFSYIGSRSAIETTVPQIAERVFRHKFANPTAANFSVSENHGRINKAIDLGQIASFEFKGPAMPGFVHFDVEFVEKKEEGLAIKLEVNTRPEMHTGGGIRFVEIAKEVFEFARNELPKILGIDVSGDL